ncbi:MAG TPA: TonB family protein, partial [Terriglobales bacterium]|nr:TonB family protein [Terriglobales bacterium]
MFSELKQRTRRLDGSRIAAIALHCLLLYVLVRPLKPIFVTPSSVAFGNNGKTPITTLVYFHQQGFADNNRRVTVPKPPKPRQKPKSEAARNQPDATQADRAGSPYGTVLSGPLSGHDVRPALPVIFPDPVVGRSELPDGVAGTVIVEITIDEIGNVIATKVLQPLGYGIEDRVVAVLRNWRFRPAT